MMKTVVEKDAEINMKNEVIADRDDETAELTKYLASSASGQVSLMN
jgi:hypothetical protein